MVNEYTEIFSQSKLGFSEDNLNVICIIYNLSHAEAGLNPFKAIVPNSKFYS